MRTENLVRIDLVRESLIVAPIVAIPSGMRLELMAVI